MSVATGPWLRQGRDIGFPGARARLGLLALLLTAAYAGIAATVSVLGGISAPLVGLLGVGGLGLGAGFATLIGHLTNAVPTEYASDISGVATTTLQIGGALGTAAFGSTYFTLVTRAPAEYALSITAVTLGVISLIAASAARAATRTPKQAR